MGSWLEIKIERASRWGAGGGEGGEAPTSLTIPLWKGGFRDKIANFSRLHCFAIPKLNIEI